MPHTLSKDRTLKALVIDETAFVRKAVSKSLAQLGVQNIIEVSDAGAAVRRLRNEHFDLVISDSQLPTMTGFELLHYIRNNDRIKHTPFLMLTANLAESQEMSSLPSIVSDFVSKPFSTEDLETKLIRLLSKEINLNRDSSSTR